MNHLLEIKNLSISFNDTNVLNQINFDIKKGEILGIVGESGSGKSISSLAIMGLLPNKAKTSGEILFNSDGQKINLLNSNKVNLKGKKIGMIFQEPMTSLNPSMTCGKQILESIIIHNNCTKKEAKRKVINLLEKVKLPNPKRIYNAYPHELSGGQKQRILIAIAISSNPKLLIADEPTTALDVTVQKSILKLLKELNKDMGMSIIFISHDLGVISEISDRIIVMYKGNIIESGEAQTILKNPQKSYTKGLMACRPSMKMRIKNLPTVADYNDGKIPDIQIESSIDREQRLESIYKEKPILVINHLNKSFYKANGLFKNKTSVKAVNDLNFALYKGETLGLVGESGSGKTTLSRTLLLLEKPDNGEIIYQGKDLAQQSNQFIREIRKNIQIIFQDPYASLNPRNTVEEILSEPMKIHNIGKNNKERLKMVKNLLEQVDLPQTAMQKYPHEFSGGQRQRIGIARAIALNPKIIICDESVSALDVSVQSTILNLLNRLKKELGLTYLFISHDLSVVKHMSDRLIILKNGRIVETGDTDYIYQNPSTEYTRNLIDAIPDKY